MTPEQAAERICWKVLFSNDDEAFKDVLDIIHSQRAEAVAEIWLELKAALQTIIENDKTQYKHHEARGFDGKTPKEVDGGTRFLTPKEIAKDLLKLSPAPQEGQA